MAEEVSYTHKVDHAEDPTNSYTLGVTDGRNNSATRVGYLYSDTGAAVSLRDAAEKVFFGGSGVDAVGPTYPGTGMSLKAVRASRVSPNVVRVTLFYDGRVGINSSVPSAERVRSDSGFVTFKTWHQSVATGTPPTTSFDTRGRPDGDRNFNYVGAADAYKKDKNRPPQPMFIQVPIQIIRVPAFLDEDPTVDVVDLLGTLNDGSVTWAGQPRDAGSLQFQRFWVEPVVVNDVIKYRVEYTFAYKKSLWVVELPPVWDASAKEWIEPEGIGGDANWYAYIAKPEDWDGGNEFPQNT